MAPISAFACGFSGDGLRVAMQLIGRPFDEGALFRIGHAYQRLTGWHLWAPKL